MPCEAQPRLKQAAPGLPPCAAGLAVAVFITMAGASVALLAAEFSSFLADRFDARLDAASSWAQGSEARTRFLRAYVAECEYRLLVHPDAPELAHRAAAHAACVQDVSDAHAQRTGVAPHEVLALVEALKASMQAVDCPPPLSWFLSPRFSPSRS